MHWRDKAQLRPREVAEVLSLSIRTIQRWIESGSIPSRVVGGCRVIRTSDVLRLVGENEGELGMGTPFDLEVAAKAREILMDLERDL